MGTTGIAPANVEQAVQYVSPTATSVSTAAWSKALLTLIGAPVNDSNVANIQTWLRHEQDATSWAQGAKGETAQQIQSNPLGVGGAGNHPSSIFSGLTLTAETLLTNPSYGLIVGSLQSNTQTNATPTPAFATAVVNSPWQSGTTTKGSYGKSVSSFLNLGQLEVNPTGFLGQIGNRFNQGASNAASDAKKVGKTVASDAEAIAGLIGDLTNPTKLKNVGIFAAGLALVGVGLVVFFITTKPGQDTAKGARDGAIVAT